MSFERFLAYIRKEIGKYCSDEYWRVVYNALDDKSPEAINRKLYLMAINAIATDSSFKNG